MGDDQTQLVKTTSRRVIISLAGLEQQTRRARHIAWIKGLPRHIVSCRVRIAHGLMKSLINIRTLPKYAIDTPPYPST